jgi:hypothetical protein
MKIKRPPYTGRQLLAFLTLWLLGNLVINALISPHWSWTATWCSLGWAVACLGLVSAGTRFLRGRRVTALAVLPVLVAGVLVGAPAPNASATVWTPGCRHVYATFEAHAPGGGPNFFRIHTDSYGCWAANGYMTGIRLTASVEMEYAGILAGYNGSGHASIRPDTTYYHWSSTAPWGNVDGSAQNCAIVGIVPICSYTTNFRIHAGFFAPAIFGGGPGLVAWRMAVTNSVQCTPGLPHCELAFSPTSTLRQGL